MHLHPNPVLPFVELQGAGAVWNPKVPVAAAAASCQFTLALNHKAAPAALSESLVSRNPKVEFEHERL
jgi:hypothetical protein